MSLRLIFLLSLLPGSIPIALSLAEPGSGGPAGDWVPVPPQSLEIPAGSPLDFSTLTPQEAAGSRGALETTPDGRLAFTGGTQNPRFNCAMIGSGALQKTPFPDHAAADALADQLKRHGYTLVRLHNVDYRLLRYAQTDLQIDPQQLDNLYYLLVALKRNGIYWMFDILSQPSTSLHGSTFSKGSSPDDLRVRLNFDPTARAKWLQMVDAVAGRKNPYTGMTVLEDPALAFVVGANENSIAFAAKPGRPFPDGLAPLFDRFIRQRYPTPDKLAGAIPDLSPEERAGKPLALPDGWMGNDLRSQLFRLFTSHLETDTYQWMSENLRQRGFHGPLLGYHDWYKSLDNRTRSKLPIIDVHAYVGEVTSQTQGARFFLPSATDDAGLGAVLTNASARWLDRPFVASEYSIPYPNPYRYEGGLLFPAMSAFQGYSTICRTAFLPVESAIPSPDPNISPMRGYSAGLDPNERAQETLSALLFYRGDVRQATRTIAVPFGDPLFSQSGSAFLPAAIRRAALLGKFGLIPADKVKSLPASTLILPVGQSPEADFRGKVVARLTDMATGRSASQLSTLAANLRANGTLPRYNRTDPDHGLFQTQTGELTIDQQRGMIAVVTPRTEAVGLSNPVDNLLLNSLTLRTINAGALVSASSLDGAPLARSHRILLILAGDTRNSGMKLDGDGQNRSLNDWGHLPILMRRVVADLALKSSVGNKGQLSVLSLNGNVIARKPVSRGSTGALAIRLDTAAVPASPTTYFLLEIP